MFQSISVFFFSFPRQNIVKCWKAWKRGIFEIWCMSDRWARGQLLVYILNFLSRLKDRKDLSWSPGEMAACTIIRKDSRILPGTALGNAWPARTTFLHGVERAQPP